MRVLPAKQITIIIAVFVAVVAVVFGDSVAAQGSDVQTLAQPGADPDTAAVIIDGEQRYVTVTTSPGRTSQCGGGKQRIPYTIHGDATHLGLDGACPDGDLLPNTVDGEPIEVTWHGAEGDLSAGLWAPSIHQHDGEFYLLYTGVSRKTGNRCIWSVHAPRLEDLKFAPRYEFLCARSNFAIDPDMFEYKGRLYVSYRYDSPKLRSGDTALYVSRVDDDGQRKGRARRLLTGRTQEWTLYQPGPRAQVHVVENPSLVFNEATGEWLLFYSGGRWAVSSYATGVASCGPKLMARETCFPLAGSDRAYVGYTLAAPPGGRTPLVGLPGNYEGSGAMSVFTTHGGQTAAVWHAWDDGAVEVALPSGYAPSGLGRKTKRWTHATAVDLPAAPGQSASFRAGPIERRWCNGEQVTVNLEFGQVPTSGNDVILGTDGDDTINGLRGNDVICGGAGNDTLIGSRGRDLLFGGEGDDTLRGSTGRDRLDGGPGRDNLYGGRHGDALIGGDGEDRCLGGKGRDYHRQCERVRSATEAGFRPNRPDKSKLPALFSAREE